MPFEASDPVSGCKQFEMATARADELLALTWSPYAGWWHVEWAKLILAVLLHAAALGGVGILQVRMWIENPDAAEEQIQRFLDRSPEPTDKFNVRNLLSTAFAPTRVALGCTILAALDAYASTCQRMGTAIAPQNYDKDELMDQPVD